MATVQQVSEAVYRARFEDQASAGAAAATAAVEKYNTAIDAGETVVTRAASRSNAVLKQWDDQGKAAANLQRLTTNLSAAQAGQAADAAAGGSKQENYARAIANLSAAVDTARSKLDALKVSTDISNAATTGAGTAAEQAAARMVAMGTATDRATQAQAAFNAATGVQKSGRSYEQAAADIATYGVEMDKLRAKYDPLFRVSKDYETALGDIDKAQKVGAISSAAAASATGRVNDAFAQGKNVYSAATGTLNEATEGHHKFSLATAGSLRELLVLGHEMSQGNFSRFGGSLFVLAERSGGLVPIFQTITSTVTSMSGIFGIFSVAAIAAFAAVEVVANSQQGKLADLRSALRATQDDYVNMANVSEATAQRVAASSNISVKAANEASKTLLSSKYFSGTSDDLERLIRDSADLGRVLGGDATAGAKKLSEGMSDTLKTAQSLAANGMRTLNASTLEQIEAFQTAGDRSKAFAVLLGAVEAATKGAAQDVSPLAKAWEELEQRFTSSSTKGHSFSEWLANDLANAVKGITEGILLLKNAMQGLNDLQTNLQNGARGLAGLGPMQTGQPSQPSGRGGSGAAPDGYAAIRDQVAHDLGIDAEAMRRVQQHEGMYANGQWQNSSTGAVGPMQLMPGTFAQMQKKYGFSGSINDDTANTYAGGYYLKEGLKASHGDLGSAYVGYHDGNGILQRGSTARPSQAALETANKITDGYNGTAITPGILNDYKALNGEMRDLAKNSISIKGTRLDEEIEKTGKAMAAEAASGGTTSAMYRGLEEHQRTLTAERYKNVDAQTAATRAEQSALAASAGLIAGEQGLNAELEKRRQIALTTGSPFGPVQEQQATLDYLAKQSQALERVSYQMGKTQNDNAQMAAAYNKGNEAVLNATASQKAWTEAEKLFPASVAQQAEAVGALTKAYRDQARTAAEAATAQQNAGSRDNLALIAGETQSIGMNSDARDKLIATMKAEQEMHRRFGDVLPQEAQDYINLAASTVEAQNRLTQVQNSFTDFQNIGVNAFNSVGDAIVQALTQGTNKTINFGDVFKGVLASIIKQLMQLAVINPVLNSLFGGTRGTLDSVMGAVGAGGAASLGGASATEASGFSGAGAMMDVGKLLIGGLATSGGLAAGATGMFGNAGSATTAALNGMGGTFGPATAGEVATQSISQGLGIGADTAGTIGTAVSSISSALPYIGTAIGVISSVAKGDYRGAGLIGAGALVGSIIPGVGTAIGAAVGGLIGSMLPNHPKNPFMQVDEGVRDGHLADLSHASQLEDVTGTLNNVRTYNDSINKFLDTAHIMIANDNSRIGMVGDLKNMTKDVTELFQTLTFKSDSTVNPNSNLGRVEAGALGVDSGGTKYMKPEELQADLVKIATLTANLDALGVQLLSVGQHVNGIQIASVDNPTGSDFRTALSHDLPGQTFKDTDAFLAEINKVNQFVNGTIPALLDPVANTSSQLQTQIQGLVKTYTDAIALAQSYGLATDGLTAAQAKAIAILQAPDVQKLTLSNLAITKRGETARGESTTQTDLQSFDIQAQQQKDALKQQYIDIYGSLIPPAKEYGAASITLDQTLSAERLKIARTTAGGVVQTEQQIAAARQAAVQAERTSFDNIFNSLEKFNSIRARQSAVMGDSKDADLLNFDSSAQKEATAYARQLVDTYGDAFYKTQDYNNRISELETVQGEERLAIIKKYADQANAAQVQAAAQASAAQAQALSNAQQQVGGVITSLTAYAQSIQTGAASPLSAQSQYSLAKNQFQAVSSAAGAGDFNSAQKLQSYAQTLLSASRTVNGSGTGYASDYNAVLTALQGVANAGSDALTNSALIESTKTQTAALSTKFDELKVEIVALRREYAQQKRA